MDTNAATSMLDIFTQGVSESGASTEVNSDQTPPETEASPQEGEQEVAQADSSEQPQDQAQPQPRIKEIVVTDEEGKKKIKVDLNDEKKLEKYVSMAYGMRKFQAERDQLKAQVSKIEPEYQELKKGWTELESAFSKEGIKGLVNLITGDQAGYEKHLQREMQRVRERENASPEQLAKMDLEERFHQEKQERERLQKQMEEYLSESRKNNEEAGIKSLEAQLSTPFEKYRFTGKLGDPEAEKMYDMATWNQVINQLKQLPETEELSPALIDKAFRDVSAKFRRVIATKVEEGTKKVIANKKIAAQEKTSANAIRHPQNSQAIKDFDSQIEQGNTRGALFDLFKSGFKF